MVEFVQHIINGLSLGSIYALTALGYTMVFGVLKFINFAHSDVLMLGAFMGYYSARFLKLTLHPSWGSLFITIAMAMVGCAVIGFLMEKFAYRPLRKAPRLNVLITAVGLSLLFEFSGQLLFGVDPKFFPQIYQPASSWHLGELIINPLQLLVLGLSLSLMLSLQLIVFKTRIGRAMRAVSFNHDYASLMGIPVDRVISFTFMVGSALAGAAGVLVALIYPKIDPLMGVFLGIKSFVAAVLGGIGNIAGAVMGSLFMGLSEEMIVGYGFPTLRDALSFGILILVLLFKPSGILGKSEVEKV